MSYAKFRNNNCGEISISLLSNQKFLSPTSNLYKTYNQQCHLRNNMFPDTRFVDKKHTNKCDSCPSPSANKSCC